MINKDGITPEVRTGLTNLVTVLGVAVFGWSAGALLIIYWIEAGVALVRGFFQGPFARREPEELTPEQQRVRGRLPLASWENKRGGVSIGPLPPVYPRNMSAVSASIIVTLIFWPIAGGLVIATVGPELPIGTVLLAVVGVVAGHTVGLINYFRNNRYIEDTVNSAMSRRYAIGVFVLGVGGVFALSRASPPSVLFLIIAIGKLLADLVIAKAEASNETLTRWDQESLEEQIPGREPTAVFKANRRDMLLRAAGIAFLLILVPPYIFVGLAAVIVGLVSGVVVGGVAFIIAIVVTMVIILGRTAVERGHLEYHVYPDQIVAYDGLLDAAQWSVDQSKIEEVTVESSRLDRIRPGSQTVVVSTYGDDRRLHALRRPETLIDVLNSGSGETQRSLNTRRYPQDC